MSRFEKTKNRSERRNAAQAAQTQPAPNPRSVPEMQTAEDTQDLVEKEFIGFPDITADVINVLLYQGKSIIKEDNLLAGPTEIIYQGKKKLRTQYEDLCKYDMADGKIHLMYLIANQSKTDGKMLLRKAGYTGGVYREQYEGKMPGVFPVIELVLYWGAPRWKSSRNLGRLFRKKELSVEEWKYIDELKLHVFEMRHLPEKTRKLFQSDMRIIVDFLAEGEDYRSDRKIRHKSALIKMIKVLSGDMDVDNVERWMQEQGIREEDEVKVCELFDQYERRGRAEGKKLGLAEGEKRGRVQGLAEGEKRGRVQGLAEGEKRGRVQGLVEGEKRGLAKGENRFANLVQVLMDSGRNDDLRKAASDQNYREQLYIEAGLV